MRNYGFFDEDEYLLYIGRLATMCGLIGFLIGWIIARVMNFSKVGSVFFILIMGYLFLTGFWGGYNLNRKFLKYRYKLPLLIWHLLRILVIILGVILGVLGWGFLEHFTLLLAMEQLSQGKGIIVAQITLIPLLGPRFARLIKFKQR